MKKTVNKELFLTLDPGLLPVLASLGLVVLSASISVWQIICVNTAKDATILIWLWAAVLAWSAFSRYLHWNKVMVWPTLRSKLLAWGILGTVVILHFCGWGDLNIFLLATSLVCFVGGLSIMVAVVVPLFLWLAAIPLWSYLQFIISYPLRRIGTMVTVPLLQLFDISVRGEGTVIYMGKKSVAITAACSGIEQLEAMLLVGWLIVFFMHSGRMARLMHFSLILPVILFCNIIRLVITLLIFHYWGDVAFNDKIHTGMGILMVVMAAVIFIALRFFFVDGASPAVIAKPEENA